MSSPTSSRKRKPTDRLIDEVQASKKVIMSEASDEEPEDEKANESDSTRGKDDGPKQVASSPSKPDKKHICPTCSRQFTSSHGLRYHIKNLVCQKNSPMKTGLTFVGALKEPDVSSVVNVKKASSKKNKPMATGLTFIGAIKPPESSAGGAATSTEAREVSKVDEKQSKHVCPHCQKSFVAALGLKYHVKNNVCRPELRTDKSTSSAISQGPKKTKKKKKSDGKYTCSLCQRVFTTDLGLSYHEKNRVCQRAKAKPVHQSVAFQTLQPGEKFVTKYGVVEVVDDSRATPISTALPNNMAARIKKYKAHVARVQTRQDALQLRRKIKSTVRQNLVLELHQLGKWNPKEIDIVLRGQVPGKPYRPPRAVEPDPPKVEDPTRPRDSMPDRIVTCEMISDERKRFEYDSDGEEIELIGVNSAFSEGTLLYLRRCELTNTYESTMPVYTCHHCGMRFGSNSGRSYHVTNRVCITKMEKANRAREDKLDTIEAEANGMVRRHETHRKRTIELVHSVLSEIRTGKRVKALTPRKKDLKKYRENPPIYPDVWLKLGFKLLPRGSQRKHISAFKGRSTSTAEKHEKAAIGRAYVKRQRTVDYEDDPRVELQRMMWEYSILKGKLIGPLYNGIAEALGFEKPKKTKPQAVFSIPKPIVVRVKKTKKKVKKPKKKKKKKVEIEKPIPQIVDPSKLVEELEAGRYPSYKPMPSDTERPAFCCLCNTSCRKMPPTGCFRLCDACGHNRCCKEPLINCTYCKNRFHWSCAEERWTMKKYETGETVLCPLCIGILISRRKRAEKRRIESLMMKNPNEVLKNLTSTEDEQALDNSILAKSCVEDREYESVAAQLIRVNELDVIVRDASVRMSNLLLTQEMNAKRREFIDPFETEDLLETKI